MPSKLRRHRGARVRPARTTPNAPPEGVLRSHRGTQPAGACQRRRRGRAWGTVRIGGKDRLRRGLSINPEETVLPGSGRSCLSLEEASKLILLY